MPTPSDAIQKILGPGGTLAANLPDFEHRPSQIQLARLMLKSLKTETPCLIEAGTGTGKTIGYLLPAVLSQKKIVISTGTKNLQEQIFFKDIPLLEKVTGQPLKATLMKGRQNYLCLHRYHQQFSQASLLSPDLRALKKEIEVWLKKTEFGDRAELNWMAEEDPWWDALSANSEQCLGSNCLYYEDCYLNYLRQKAAQSKIIIVNHHLFFADLMVKQGGFGEIIPRFEAVIFDEAHLIEEIATTYFGEMLSTQQLLELIADVEKGLPQLEDLQKKTLKGHLDFIRLGAQHIREHFLEGPEKAPLDAETIRQLDLGPAHTIRKGLRYLLENPEQIAPDHSQGQSIAVRAEDLTRRLKITLTARDPDWLNWYERHKKSLHLHASPLDISRELQQTLYQKVPNVILTSATLSTGGHFDYIRTRLGIEGEVLQGIYPSHFDFANQALLYVPKDLPLPNETDFGLQIAPRILRILQITAGRALVLFTSHHNLNLVHSLLLGKIPYTLYKQGEAPHSTLLQAFKEDTHSVLLATGSFWQGVDVPGETLSCLIIDKLPFDAPGEPLVAARIDSIRAQGGNPFLSYQIPSAIIALKQGIGRLIRAGSDQGIIAILDRRLIDSRYGRFFFESLPPIPLSHKLEDIRAFFNSGG
jgi:ATP-dependent DNA helicase DinG